jgi:PhnB protein
MKINPYLFFNDKQCGDAFRFYEKALGGKNLVIMNYADAPEAAAHVPPEMKNAVIHASLTVGDTLLMGSDGSGEDVGKPQAFSVSLQTGTPEEAKRAFDALSAGGNVRMPLGKTFFSPAFGMLTDKFGVPWMVNCDQAG